MCSYAWVLTLNICASGHSVETGWPSCVRFSQLSCPFEGDKWISRIMQVRSPGVKNWLFSHASTSVLPGCLCMLALGGLHLWFSAPKCLFPWNYICKSNADTLNWCLLHIQILSPGGEYAKVTVPNIYLKGRRVGVRKCNYFWKDITNLNPRLTTYYLTSDKVCHFCMSLFPCS